MTNPVIHILEERTFLNTDGEVVPADSPDAVRLLGVKGGTIGIAQAVKLGLAAKPGSDKPDKRPEASKAAHAKAKADSAKARKGAKNKADL